MWRLLRGYELPSRSLEFRLDPAKTSRSATALNSARSPVASPELSTSDGNFLMVLDDDCKRLMREHREFLGHVLKGNVK